MSAKLLSLQKKLKARISKEQDKQLGDIDLIKLLTECEQNIYIDNAELYEEIESKFAKDNLDEASKRIVRSIYAEGRIMRARCEKIAGMFRQSQIDLSYYKSIVRNAGLSLVRDQENEQK